METKAKREGISTSLGAAAAAALLERHEWRGEASGGGLRRGLFAAVQKAWRERERERGGSEGAHDSLAHAASQRCRVDVAPPPLSLSQHSRPRACCKAASPFQCPTLHNFSVSKCFSYFFSL